MFGSCIESCLLICWCTFIWWKNPPKCCSILVWTAGCWNSLLQSRNPKNNWCFSRIFGALFGGKDRGLSTCKPWFKQAGSWIHFCMKRLRILNSYQIFKIKIKIKKPIAIDVLFKAYPMVPLSCRSNMAGGYLKDFSKNVFLHPTVMRADLEETWPCSDQASQWHSYPSKNSST